MNQLDLKVKMFTILQNYLLFRIKKKKKKKKKTMVDTNEYLF